jgi:hypothetical protein
VIEPITLEEFVTWMHDNRKVGWAGNEAKDKVQKSYSLNTIGGFVESHALTVLLKPEANRRIVFSSTDGEYTVVEKRLPPKFVKYMRRFLAKNMPSKPYNVAVVKDPKFFYDIHRTLWVYNACIGGLPLAWGHTLIAKHSNMSYLRKRLGALRPELELESPWDLDIESFVKDYSDKERKVFYRIGANFMPPSRRKKIQLKQEVIGLYAMKLERHLAQLKRDMASFFDKHVGVPYAYEG